MSDNDIDKNENDNPISINLSENMELRNILRAGLLKALGNNPDKIPMYVSWPSWLDDGIVCLYASDLHNMLGKAVKDTADSLESLIEAPIEKVVADTREVVKRFTPGEVEVDYSGPRDVLRLLEDEPEDEDEMETLEESVQEAAEEPVEAAESKIAESAPEQPAAIEEEPVTEMPEPEPVQEMEATQEPEPEPEPDQNLADSLFAEARAQLAADDEGEEEEESDDDLDPQSLADSLFKKLQGGR